jgi:hypothetical protein
MITLDLSILNQKGTPMFYSDTLAARPTFGIAGRIFIDIASPYGIYRDTGSAWDQIAGTGGGGGITGSGTVNTIAMFTPSGTAIGDSAITQTGTNVTVGARNLIVTNGAFTLSHTHNPVNGTFNPYGEQIAVTNTFNAGITWTALLACFNSSSLQNNLFNGSVTFGNASYTTNNLNFSNITFNAAGSTITSTQASGGIRAYANQILQLRIDGTNNGTYTHYANSAIYGDFASSTARFTITNRYGYLVNNLDEYSAGHTYTNRWAFYNAGINDNNFFAGKVGIGSGYTPSTYQLDVKGTAAFMRDINVNGLVVGTGATNNNTNTGFGYQVFNGITSGIRNVAIGYNTLATNTSGTDNVGVGEQSLNSNRAGNENTGVGRVSLGLNFSGSSNSGLGNRALLQNQTGSNNTGIGVSAGESIASGAANTITDQSIYIGNNTRALANNQINQIVIGYNAVGAGSNTVTLGHTTIIKTILRGTINAANTPTSPAGLVAGDIWNNLGILTIV